MDDNLSAIIIAVITGLFSTLSLVIKSRQEKVITKIDTQNEIMQKEKALRDRLKECEKERMDAVEEIIVLILDTNLRILERYGNIDEKKDLPLFDRAVINKRRLKEVSDSLKSLLREYEMILDVSTLFQQEVEKLQKSKKGK